MNDFKPLKPRKVRRRQQYVKLKFEFVFKNVTSDSKRPHKESDEQDPDFEFEDDAMESVLDTIMKHPPE